MSKNVHVITGGGGGIGFEIADRITEGVIVLAELSEDRLVEPKAKLEAKGVEVKTFVADVSSEENVVALIEYANSLGEIKSFVHSAGVSGGQANTPVTLKINLLGSYYVAKNLLPYIKENGVLLLVASMVGHTIDDRNEDYLDALINPEKEGNFDLLIDYIGESSDLAYQYSKQGVIQLVRRFVVDYGLKGARINSISPGVIMTEMGELAAKDHPETMESMRLNTPVQRFGYAEDIANVAEFLLSDAASFVSGTDFLVDGGLLTKIK